MAKVLHQDISDYICGLDADARVALLLTYSLGRILMKEQGRGGDWKALAASVDGRHVADWLRAAVANGADWLNNTDELGRAKKLMKFSTVAQVAEEADRAMAVANQVRVDYRGRSERLVMDLGDGYQLVRLKTPEALDYESSIMQHCIGQGGYDAALMSTDCEFLSLRRGVGKPHVTIAIEQDYIAEIKGKQNAHPAAEYIEVLTPFFRSRPQLKFLRSSGIVFDTSRRPMHIRSLPDGAVIDGDLRISGGDSLELPENLTVTGDLEIRYAGNVVLPKHLRVGGTSNFEDCRLEGVIERLEVDGWCAFFVDVRHDTPCFLSSAKVDHLGFEGTQITRLPEVLRIKSLTVADSPISDLGPLGPLTMLRLSSLPNLVGLPEMDGLEDLELSDLPIREFDALPATRNVTMANMDIDRLPDGLALTGDLTFAGCIPSRMPESLNVGAVRLIEPPGAIDLDAVVFTASRSRPSAAP